MPVCIFCKIIKGELPGKFVYRDGQMAAFHDINPKAPVHVLLMPVKHVESIREINEEDKALLGELILAVKKIAQKLGIDKSGYKVVVNNGQGAGQLVLHLHFHVLGGWSNNPKWEV